jgi:hypothetical protein
MLHTNADRTLGTRVLENEAEDKHIAWADVRIAFLIYRVPSEPSYDAMARLELSVSSATYLGS